MPEGYEDSAKKENKVLLTFERIGEVLTCVIVLVFSDFNPRKTIWVTWLVISFVFMILYEIYWIRYFKSEHTMMDMYSSLFGIPVARATRPIISFVFLGIYGSNVFLLVSVIILGIGHIGIHLQHRNEVYEKRQRKLITRFFTKLFVQHSQIFWKRTSLARVATWQSSNIGCFYFIKRRILKNSEM